MSIVVPGTFQVKMCISEGLLQKRNVMYMKKLAFYNALAYFCQFACADS